MRKNADFCLIGHSGCLIGRLVILSQLFWHIKRVPSAETLSSGGGDFYNQLNRSSESDAPTECLTLSVTSERFASLKLSRVPTRYPVIRRIRSNLP